jgi:hypothetical protein
MASQGTTMIQATIYGMNGNDLPLLAGAGTIMAFPIQKCILRVISPAVNYSGTLCNATIQLLPTGPSPIQPQYYTNSTVAALTTAGNA